MSRKNLCLSCIFCGAFIQSSPCFSESIYTYKNLLNTAILKPIQYKNSSLPNNQFFQTDDGKMIGLGHQFFITTTSPDSDLLVKILEKYNLTLIKPVIQGTYLVASHDQDILPLIGTILKDANILNSYPDFIKKPTLR